MERSTSNNGGSQATVFGYGVAKTSVWWDIKNCQVPKEGYNPNAIAQNISASLGKMGYCGPLSISAYGDTNVIPDAVQHALSSTGISLYHVPSGIKVLSFYFFYMLYHVLWWIFFFFLILLCWKLASWVVCMKFWSLIHDWFYCDQCFCCDFV